MALRGFIAPLLLVCAQQAGALTVSVDSDLDDWLADKPEGDSSDWTPRDDAEIKWIEGDQNNGYLNPGWGGQDYDAEAIYVNRSEGFILDAETLDSSFLVHWTMACANDFVQVDPPGRAPNPAPLSLLTLGLLALTARHRRGRRTPGMESLT